MNLVTLLLLLPLCVESEDTMEGTDNQVVKDYIKKADENVEKLKDLITKMEEDSSTTTSIPGDKKTFATKIKTVGKKWTQATKEAYDSDKEGNAERISGAISGAGEGLVGMVNGIKNKDWKSGVKGALKIASSLAQLAGPAGMIASSVMSFISSLFDLFGGSGKTESMDDKMERIVAEQIDVGREKDLKADVEGMKITYRSICNSLQHFRESKNLKVDQANELYNLVFTELQVLGKLRARINDKCDNLDDFDKVGTCLSTVNIFTEASILRQLMLTDMASLMADINEHHQSLNQRSESAEDTTGLLVVGNNLLHIIKKEQESDGEFLRFFTDPFNAPKRRYTIAIFFQNPEKYSSLKTYIMTLDKTLPDGMFRDYVMVCKKIRLQGECNILKKGGYLDLNKDPGGWGNSIASFYIPRRLKLKGYDTAKKVPKVFGSFPGPNAYTEVKGGNTWDKVKISDTERDATEEVKICEKENMYPKYCDTVPEGSYNLDGFHGVQWFQRTRSMVIPTGLTVHGFVKTNEKDGEFSYFVGPQTINKVYRYENWTRIKVEKTSGVSDATEHVWLCDGENLSGECRTHWQSINDLAYFTGTDFSKKIKSLKLPGGMQITGYSKKNYKGARYGPYTGPAIISKVDAEKMWVSFKMANFGVEQ